MARNCILAMKNKLYKKNFCDKLVLRVKYDDNSNLHAKI